MTLAVTALSALQDNYIWLIKNAEETVIVDPGESGVVIDYLKKNKLRATAIFITHHHFDHTDGINELVAEYNIPVYGPQLNPIPHCSEIKGNSIKILGNNFSVLAVPGHTLDHIAYYGHNMLFCGDTLFAAGIGRIFEGTAEQMYTSINKIKQLEKETIIYPAHEYTKNNLIFALEVEPNNIALQQRWQKISAMPARNITLPTDLATEMATNPFLRTKEPSIIIAVKRHFNQQPNSDKETFAMLRAWKDNFNP